MRTYLRVPAAVLGLLFLLLSFTGGAVAAEEAYTINGVNVRYRDFSSSPNNCWAYAYNFYYKIWDETFRSDFYDRDNLLRDLSTEELRLTPEHLKEYVSKATPGAVLRVCGSDCLYGGDAYGHSMLIVSIQEDGFMAFEGGLSGPCSREYFYTWEEFCTTSWLGARYGYIKYIKWPSASEVSLKEQEVASPDSDVPERPSRLEMLEALEAPQVVTYESGDMDCSGALDAADYVMLKRFVGGTLRLTEAQMKSGDLNGDGRIDRQDFLLLKSCAKRGQLLPQMSFSEFAVSLLNYLF